MVTREQILNWLEGFSEVLSKQRDYLTDLDSAIGDADHGNNMERGFKKVMTQLPGLADKDIGDILKSTGMALLSSVGGASGPLYGTFFMRAGMAAGKKEGLSAEELGQVLQAGLEGVVQRGKAKLEDKTMVDALTPALEAYQMAVEEGADAAAALQRAAAAAEVGMTNTTPLVAKKGRASYLGARSAGHQDPGATSTYYMINTLSQAVNEQ